MKTSLFDYQLPEELIAQEPAQPRDSCRLMVVHTDTGALEHRRFTHILEYLRPGDLLVVNDTKVRPARLQGHKLGVPSQQGSEVSGQRAPNQLSSGQRAFGRQGSEAEGSAVEVLLLTPVPALDTQLNTQLNSNLDAQLNTQPSIQPSARLDTSQGTAAQHWQALVKPGRRLKPGSRVVLTSAKAPGLSLNCDIVAWGNQESRGQRLVRLSPPQGQAIGVKEALAQLGSLPLPPYIKGYAGDTGLYQTVYARTENSAAAPTAGLHFSEELLAQACKQGVQLAHVCLEIGLDTFRTVEAEELEHHVIHSERYHVSEELCEAVRATRRRGGRVVAVGTTVVRALESAADARHIVHAVAGEETRLYIMPGYRYRVVDALLTNFHTPRSTLLALVAAFSGYDTLWAAYQSAIAERYRFFSFGDAMLLVPGSAGQPPATSGNAGQPPATSGNAGQPPATSGNAGQPRNTSKGQGDLA